MPTAPVRLLAAMLLYSSLAAAMTTQSNPVTASSVDPVQYCKQREDCGACTSNNFDSSVDAVCSWCHSTGRCTLAYSRTTPAAATWLAGPGKCAQYTLDRGTCKCRPDVYTDCDSCTKHIGCVWIKAARTLTTLTLTLPILGNTTSVRAHNFSNVCWAGNGVTGPSFRETEIIGDRFKLAFSSTSERWCWGQCAVEGQAVAITVIVACFVIPCVVFMLIRLIMCGIASGVCGRCWPSSRKNRDGIH